MEIEKSHSYKRDTKTLKLVSGYSKGMRQKVGIAIAYAKKAKVYTNDK